MLGPHLLRLGGALGDAMRVLDGGVELALRRHEFGAHAGGFDPPVFPTVARDHHPAAGDADRDVPGVARMDADRMDPRLLGAATEPVLLLRARPQRIDELPGFAA